MAGYQIPPGTIVNNIKSLLRERYKQGFPIIKEIIQNANDGRATNLDFGVLKGFGGNSVLHHLLGVPALFFLNNGTFTKSDQEAIRCFGIDANANDKGKIGKFGLGQKSIFHFCEAFFYIARSQDIPEGYGEFINPWANADGVDSKRPDWGEISIEDRQFLEKYLISHNLVRDESNYFLLWVPLRQKMADERCILANYYVDAKSVESNLPKDMNMRIGQLLPLLRHIKNVRYWLEDDSGSLQKQFSVSLDNNSACERCIYPNSEKKLIQQDEHDIQGKINISLNTAGICFAGKERILPATDFSSLLGQKPENISNNFWEYLQESSYWTKRVSINEFGESESTPDKSIPHCAVVFTKQSANNQHQGRLILQWSVFLPLASDDNAATASIEKAEQEAYEVINCEGSQDYTVFLHGYFFLDSGRKYIEGLQKIRTGAFVQKVPTNEDEMIAQWNYLLATKGTLKLFLPSLENFVKVHNLSTLDISNLSQAIISSFFFKSKIYNQSICSEFQWVFRIKPSFSGWELITVNSTVRSLPGIPPTWQLFPALENLATTCCLIDKQKPNLLLHEKYFDWTEAQIVEILVSLDLNILFTDSQNFNYFLKFLQLNKGLIGQPQIQTCLIQILKTIFTTKISFDKIKHGEINQAIQQIVEYIHPKKRLKLRKLSENEQSISILLKRIYSLDIQNPLLIYEVFEPETTHSDGSLSHEQVKSLLNCLSQLLQQENTQVATRFVVEQILEQSERSSSVESILNSIGHLPLFLAHHLQNNQSSICSYLELQSFQEKFLLFKGTYQTGIAAAVKKALPNCKLIFIDGKIASLLGKTSRFKTIPILNSQSCLQLLDTKPDLAKSTQRVTLLQELINHV